MFRSHLMLLSISLAALAGCGDDSSEETAPGVSAGIADEPADLIGTEWEWVSTQTPVERIEAGNPARYTLRLQADGTAVFQFDCNRGNGSYQIAANGLTFGPLISTRMACPDDTQDFVFMSQLERITSYFFQDGELFLEMPVDSGTMRFRRASD